MSTRIGKPKGAGEVSKAINTVKFFHEHIVNGEPVTACAKKLNLSRKTLHGYKRSADFRQMAIEHMESSTLGGLAGTVSKLVTALDAKKPIVIDNADGSTKVKMVPDNKTRMTALDQVVRIYGLHAPVKKDVTVGVSIQSDAELFDAIGTAERACRFVQSQVKGENGFGLVTDEQGAGSRDFESRGRTLLCGTPIPESVGRECELATQDSVGCSDV